MMQTKVKSVYQMPTIEIVEIAPINTILEGSNENIGGGDLTGDSPVIFGFPLEI